MTEDGSRGDGFLADVVTDWEAATAPAVDGGLRVVLVRTGIVQAAAGGTLKLLRPLFAAGLGGVAPWMLGFEYLDPIFLTGVSLSSVVLVAAVVGIAGSDADPSIVSDRVLAIAVSGTVYALIVILFGLAVVNVKNWHGLILLPATVNLVTLPLLPAGLSAYLGAEGIRMAHRGYRSREIGARFRWGVLLLVMAWYLRSSWMPVTVADVIDSQLTSGTVALATVAIALLTAVAAAFRVRALRLAH